jgi:hypothetical protein
MHRVKMSKNVEGRREEAVGVSGRRDKGQNDPEGIVTCR